MVNLFVLALKIFISFPYKMTLEKMKVPEVCLSLYNKKYLPDIQDVENYQQLRNACGLASILMLADLEKNKAANEFLIQVSQIIKPLMESADKLTDEHLFKYLDYELQYAVQYLLLKSLSQRGYPDLYNFLQGELGTAYSDQKAVHLHEIKEQYKN